MYKEDLALNNLQWLICLKTQLNQDTFFSGVLPLCTGYGQCILSLASYCNWFDPYK